MHNQPTSNSSTSAMYSKYEMMNEIVVYTTMSAIPRLSISMLTREKFRLIHIFAVFLTSQAVTTASGNLKAVLKLLMNIDTLKVSLRLLSAARPL